MQKFTDDVSNSTLHEMVIPFVPKTCSILAILAQIRSFT